MSEVCAFIRRHIEPEKKLQQQRDQLLGVYKYLDLVPKGRNEAELPWTMAWVRYHDRYTLSA